MSTNNLYITLFTYYTTAKSPLSRAFKKQDLLFILFMSVLLVIVDLEGNKEFILVD